MLRSLVGSEMCIRDRGVFGAAVGFGYWVFLALTVSLGNGGILPPTLAAWLANGTLGLVGIYFLLGID